MNTRIERIRLGDLKLLEVNARYMRHETFKTLVDNIRRDGALTSAPFGVRDGDGYLILSGNHRVKAAVEALGEDTIVDVLVTDDELSREQRVAIQLSHNAIAGEDDPATLKILYEELDEIMWRDYSGLDDKTLDLLAEVGTKAIDIDEWDACAGLGVAIDDDETERPETYHEWAARTFDLRDAEGKRIVRLSGYGGLDLASVRDLTALILVLQSPDGMYDVLCRFWCPEDGVQERSKRDGVPYADWVRDGFLIATPAASEPAPEAGLRLTPDERRVLYALSAHATNFEWDGAVARDETADPMSNVDAYDRRILLVTLRAALAALSREPAREPGLREALQPFDLGHTLLFPPHPDGFYQSSALCSCGDYQWDGETARAVIAASAEVWTDWHCHVRAALSREPAPEPPSDFGEQVISENALGRRIAKGGHRWPFG